MTKILNNDSKDIRKDLWYMIEYRSKSAIDDTAKNQVKALKRLWKIFTETIPVS